eukprot:CAMPEP_0204635356 /NCGR_PEP_ID=MMETSP0717-20131115/31386_1 /ASSEMBLY_ACC=CAM_ASM_000666 /TAXON_ID=230516 /ORGANISM="Chaetoceros curvisetus" /LENGTH=35 /DNA_ID= /DNA_START= /DNA_END= /DNA_ORIENTATION=
MTSTFQTYNLSDEMHSVTIEEFSSQGRKKAGHEEN